MPKKAEKPRRHHHAAGQPAAQKVIPQVVPAESKEQLSPRENDAVDVAPDRIDMDPKCLDRENPVCSLPPEKGDAAPDR
jgi:hypothetical protein